MPLSKDKQAEWMRKYRAKHRASVIPSVIPKSVHYAGNHFGEVRNEYYAKQFFDVKPK